MKVEKYLIVEKVELSFVGNAPYRLFLRDPQDYQLKSEFTIGREELIEANIDPTDRIIGKKVLISLKSAKGSREDSNSKTLSIQELQRLTSTDWSYATIPPGKRKEERYIIRLKTTVMGGTLTILPCPLYKLELSLTEQEYEKVRRLPKGSVFKIGYRLEISDFTDIVLSYQSYFNSPRILPKGYMLPAVEIEARSIDGNIKACESICETLMDKAKEIFKLRHHSVHLSVERYCKDDRKGSGLSLKNRT